MNKREQIVEALYETVDAVNDEWVDANPLSVLDYLEDKLIERGFKPQCAEDDKWRSI